MPELKLGTTAIKQLRLGTTVIKKAYLGSTLVFSNAYEFTYTSDTKSRNLYTDLINDGWDGSSDVEVTINSGVDIGSTSTSGYALDCHSMPNSVTLTLINNGYIRGAGGAGGAGAQDDNTPTFYPGGTGGPALRLGCTTIITNGSGYIWGGGGGGGGSNRYQEQVWYDDGGKAGGYYLTVKYHGGGGGGGAGWLVGAYGWSTGSDYNGNVGTMSAGGAGGAGEKSSSLTGGGNGGGPGSAGGSGKSSGGSGGAAGKAIHKNGFTPTFTSGNNSTRVKGAVS